jgi:U3 small nucleolar RNA-associated protein 11
MSSMRNAIPRRSHRERPQPHERTRRGLLEKRKDYVLRAKDHKRKQATLKRLSEKASERNPDEFYFGMTRQRTENGVPVAERPTSKVLSVKEVRPLKMQDRAYLQTMMGIDRRRIEKLRGVVGGVDGLPRGKKILFAENEEEARELREKGQGDMVKVGGMGRSREARELEGRMERVKELRKKEREATVQVQLMGKGSRQKVRRKDEDSDDETIPVYKWKPQRQK